MDLKLLQSDVAKIFLVSVDCVTYWENHRSEPQIKHFPKIIKFLGYCPIEFDKSTLAGRIKAYRWINGLSISRFGKMVGVDGSTVIDWEKEGRTPKQETLKKLEVLLRKMDD